MEDTIKELNASSHAVNAKHKRHTGKGCRCNQKSRSYSEDKSRKWRKRSKAYYSSVERNKTKDEIKHNNFTTNERLIPSNRFCCL